jgi:hypothetical protein
MQPFRRGLRDIGIPSLRAIGLNPGMPWRRRALPPVHRSRFSAARAGVADVARLSQRIPLFPVERAMRLADVAAARAAAPVRIGWAALFLKAYALVAAEMPILRTWLVRRLIPRLATAPDSVATLAVNRDDGEGDHLFFARLPHPDTRSLVDIQQFVTQCSTGPVDEVFKRQLQFEQLPAVLRRMVLRWNINSFSPRRATRIGTFSLSTLAGFGAVNRFHPTICTTSLSYGPLDPDGSCLVTLIADHRVLDGVAAARALERLEAVLATRIMAELGSLSHPQPADGREAAA